MNNNKRQRYAKRQAYRRLATRALLPMVLLGNGSQAATVHLAGQNIDFYYDDAQAGVAFFTPQLSATGYDLTLTPNGIYAQSEDGVGVNTGSRTDVVDPNFTFRAVVRTGIFPYESITLRESGEYRMTSTSPGNAFVSIGSILTISETANFANTSFTEMMSSDNLTLADGNLHTWGSSGIADLSGANWSGVSSIYVTYQTNLTAGSAGVGNSAFIQLSTIDKSIVFSLGGEVPVPAAIWLFGSGLLGLVGVARARTT